MPTRRSHVAGSIMLIGALAGGLYFLSDFLAVAALAILTVAVFNPIYYRLLGWLRGHTNLATAFTVVIALIIVVIPLIVVAMLSYFQALTFFANAQTNGFTDPNTLIAYLRNGINGLNNLLGRLPDGHNLQLSADNTSRALEAIIPSAGQATLTFLRDSAGGLVDFFTGLILYLVLLVYLFLHQTTLISWIKSVSPLADAINDRYLAHMTAAGRSMVFGTFIVGAVQGILGALFLTIAGIPYPMFWAVILTILSFIPLGGGILTIPIGIIELLIGNTWQGLFILATHLIVVTNIDNVLRALLVSKKAQLPSIITLFAAFAGIKFFGAVGVIFGPIIMVVVMTTIQIYNEFGKDGIPLKGGRRTL